MNALPKDFEFGDIIFSFEKSKFAASYQLWGKAENPKKKIFFDIIVYLRNFKKTVKGLDAPPEKIMPFLLESIFIHEMVHVADVLYNNHTLSENDVIKMTEKLT